MAMLLQGENGTEFELSLIEDQPTDVQDGFGDDTALTLGFRVATMDESWEESSPCPNLFEVQNLLEWLQAVAQGTPDEAEVELLSAELRFLIVKDLGDKGVVLRVGFHLEGRPEEFSVDAETTEVDHVDMKLGRDQLRVAVAQLRRDLEELHADAEDDIDGMDPLAQVSRPDPDLAIIDDEIPEPPGAGDGEDNAGGR